MAVTREVVTCSECGGTDVQTVDWILPNTARAGVVQLAAGEPYSSSGESDSNWCNTCDAHVILTYTTITEDAMTPDEIMALRKDDEVVLRWPGSNSGNNSKLARVARVAPNGSSVLLEVARTDLKGHYTGEWGKPRSFAATDVLGKCKDVQVPDGD